MQLAAGGLGSEASREERARRRRGTHVVSYKADFGMRTELGNKLVWPVKS